jgi:hypothetical protein
MTNIPRGGIGILIDLRFRFKRCRAEEKKLNTVMKNDPGQFVSAFLVKFNNSNNELHYLIITCPLKV